MNLLDLPEELIEHILDLVHADDVVDVDPAADQHSHKLRLHLTKRLANYKRNVLPVCHRFHGIGLKALYSHVHVGHPRAFDVFRYELFKNPSLAPLVRCLDFSDYTSIGLGRTRRMNREIQMVTTATITDVLQQTVNLREFLVSESIEDELGKSVLDTLFSLPYLEAVDFCGASSAAFTHSLSAVRYPSSFSHLARVSFHECVSVPPSVFEELLPRLGKLTRLDLTHTQVTVSALMSIPHSARITHLSIAKCRSLRGAEIMRFLTTHPSVASLKWLSLQWTDLSPDEITVLLESLPATLTHLNLYGLPVNESHMPLLPAALEETSLAYADISLDTIISTFAPRKSVKYLDLTGNPNLSLWTIGDLKLLRACPHILTWEFDAQPILSKLIDAKTPGYTVVLGQGRRGWIFKDTCDALTHSHSCGNYVLGMDMGNSEAWAGASRKIDCSGSQYGGGLERGIYLYYAYRTK